MSVCLYRNQHIPPLLTHWQVGYWTFLSFELTFNNLSVERSLNKHFHVIFNTIQGYMPWGQRWIDKRYKPSSLVIYIYISTHPNPLVLETYRQQPWIHKNPKINKVVIYVIQLPVQEPLNCLSPLSLVSSHPQNQQRSKDQGYSIFCWNNLRLTWCWNVKTCQVSSFPRSKNLTWVKVGVVKVRTRPEDRRPAW